MNTRTRTAALVLGAQLFGYSAAAQTADPGAPLAASAPPAPTAASAAAPPSTSSATSAPPAAVVDSKNAESCVERIPSGKDRPHFSERIAQRALSGHALTLEVTVDHGKGETVLPTGFHLLSDSPEGKALEREGFALPDPQGSAGPKLERTEQGERATTKVRVSVVPLPPKPGRHELVLPPLPIAISRASGEVLTVCTKAHSVLIEDPIANAPNPTPRANPGARRQLDVWTTAKHVATGVLIALVVGAVGALLISRWLRRPKKQPPPPPPRPPWDLALEALHDIRHAGLTREGRFAEVFDRVSDVLRRYLGDRYGYDGLESTTREALTSLRQTTPAIDDLPGIETFMRDADLVKFARLTPSEGECLDLLSRAESIVTRTMLITPLPPPAPEAREGEGDGDGEVEDSPSEPSEPKNPGSGS
ncbi:MAG TPA: hypothetical protein VFK05_32375 [Polyangiaceae bacterium]|nr:hypothetical protein [Polyangiaceae bacterium]